jgi:hypothetical protein
VVVVDGLDEWLDLGSLSCLLGTSRLSDLGWVSLDTSNKGMWKLVALGAFVVSLDNNNLLTGVTTTNDNGYNKMLESTFTRAIGGRIRGGAAK